MALEEPYGKPSIRQYSLISFLMIMIRMQAHLVPQPLRNGYAAGVAYASYSYMTTSQMTSLLIVCSGLALACYLRAFDAEDRRKEALLANAEAEARIDAIRQEGRKSRRRRREDSSPERSGGPSGVGIGRNPSRCFIHYGPWGHFPLLLDEAIVMRTWYMLSKSVATHKIGGAFSGALGNFSKGIGVKSAKKSKKSYP